MRHRADGRGAAWIVQARLAQVTRRIAGRGGDDESIILRPTNCCCSCTTPYTHVLKSEIVIQHIYDDHYQGATTPQVFWNAWRKPTAHRP
jgi:hypothetical protein